MSYPKIFSVSHKTVQDVFREPVCVTEKMDGSQFNFGVREDGKLIARSRGAEIDVENPIKTFELAVRTVLELAHTGKLKPGRMYHAEAITKPKQNVLLYARIPMGGLVLFDISNTLTPGDYVAYPHMVNIAKQLDLEVVPCLHYGEVYSAKELEHFLEIDSFLGGTKLEGIVIKNYKRFGRDGHPIFAKMIRPEYREAHKMEWKAGPNVRKQLIKALATEARWQKAVQHMAELDLLVNAPQDIGPLLREINQDLLLEETDRIKDKLFNAYWKEISRGVCRGFPEWYKKRLAGDEVQTSGVGMEAVELVSEVGEDTRPAEGV